MRTRFSIMLAVGVTVHSERAVPSPRALTAAATGAAERGSLDAWVRPWRDQIVSQRSRSALFAVASFERLRYRYARADSLYARVMAQPSSDALARQAQLWRAIMDAVQGRYAAASISLARVESLALADHDTLTALDAILARSGTTARVEGATPASAVLQHGDALRWSREPALDAGSRCRAATLRSRLGDPEAARRLAREGAAIALRAQLPRLEGACLFALATDFARGGVTDSLRAPLLRAIAIQRRTGDLAGLAASSQWAGFYITALGHFTDAQPHLVTAWDASQRAGTVDVSAWTAVTRASVAQSFYDAAAASLWLGRADSLMRYIDDARGQVEVSRMRARQALVVGDASGARLLLRDALAAAERTGEPGGRITVLAALRDLEMRDGRLDSAASWLEKERALIAQYGLVGWNVALAAGQAQLALRRGEAGNALRLLDQVLASTHATQRYFRFDSEMKRALALAMGGDARGAARTAMAATETFDDWRASLSDSSLRLLAVQAQRERGWFTSSLSARLAEAGELPTVFALAERRRARDLRDRLAMASSPRRGAAPVSGGDDRVANGALSVRAAQRMIPDARTALVMLDPGEDGARGTALVVTRDGLSAHALPAVEELAPRIRRLIALMEAGREAGTDARALGSALLTPMLPALDSAGITRLILMPEGVLHRLPFDVLRLPDGRFLVERFETAVAPSATLLAQLIASSSTSTSRSRTRVLALADAPPPTMRHGDAAPTAQLLVTAFDDARRYPRLAGARDEVRSIQRAFPNTDARVGSNATEFDVKRLARDYQLLHFATHAVVDEWSGSTAALALGGGNGDDGMLESGEIASLQLSASLVVLSACRTIAGEVVAGEGVRGLTSAFVQAGARSVIATAWRVDDRAVAPLMRAFYEALSRGATVGSALHAARIDAMRRHVSPSVWGAFILVGDPWRTILSDAGQATARGSR